MLALSVVMYAVSATHWALIVTLSLVNRHTYRHASEIIFVILYLPTINYILSDGIVLWRAWVLWNRRLLVFIPPLISLVCTLGATIASSAYYLLGYLAIAHRHFSHLVEDDSLGFHLEWAIWFLTVGTNLWATGLIFIRAWQHRRFLRSLSIKETSRSNADKALTFLVESGAIYLCIWIAYIATSMFDPYGSQYGLDFSRLPIAQIVGMYPTTIIVVVTMRLSAVDILSRSGVENDTHITHIAFSPPPADSQPKTPEIVQSSFGGIFVATSSDTISA